ncbi:hypothetical protein HMPREF0201_03163 [Cedecea davisae DSM 4568]|uniref:Uncharacterized protein n=1 Tax=Cedecea davisae DSM 4568 TaxID=566551 RepID=S3ITV6_9ENTR|nr:hypothetical protein HMPREF0201_03163 [Cedecea davisae DSM 4568]
MLHAGEYKKITNRSAANVSRLTLPETFGKKELLYLFDKS